MGARRPLRQILGAGTWQLCLQVGYCGDQLVAIVKRQLVGGRLLAIFHHHHILTTFSILNGSISDAGAGETRTETEQIPRSSPFVLLLPSIHGYIVRVQCHKQAILDTPVASRILRNKGGELRKRVGPHQPGVYIEKQPRVTGNWAALSAC